MRKPKKSTLVSSPKVSNSLTKRMKTNIMKDFSAIFDNPAEMWNILSSEFTSIEKTDAEMTNGLKKLGQTISKFNETQDILKKKDGINIEEALDIVEKRKNREDDEYPFILFIILKNLEHSGLIKINRKAERIARKALRDYETSRKK